MRRSPRETMTTPLNIQMTIITMSTISITPKRVCDVVVVYGLQFARL